MQQVSHDFKARCILPAIRVIDTYIPVLKRNKLCLSKFCFCSLRVLRTTRFLTVEASKQPCLCSLGSTRFLTVEASYYQVSSCRNLPNSPEIAEYYGTDLVLIQSQSQSSYQTQYYKYYRQTSYIAWQYQYQVLLQVQAVRQYYVLVDARRRPVTSDHQYQQPLGPPTIASSSSLVL